MAKEHNPRMRNSWIWTWFTKEAKRKHKRRKKSMKIKEDLWKLDSRGRTEDMTYFGKAGECSHSWWIG